ncbi:MAG: GDP-L-fucose synthase [Candidatus Heimdallarchaeota archaeon]|nr:GDP-L-fucose synthase [Candidatus Heimdallarchaeota archaeon]
MKDETSLDGKRILLTGGKGFFGQHIQNELRKESPEEIILPDIPEYDLRYRENVKAVLKNVDVVIHAAGTVSGIGGIQRLPATTFYDNAMMAILMMEEAYRANVDKLVTIGTACSYPKFGNIPLKESEIWDGYPEETNAPYGIAKRLFMAGSEAYRIQYDFNSIPLIIFNLFGPGDNFNPATSHVIPALIKKCFEDEKLVVWGDGSPTRSFLYVKDAARAIVMATKKYNESSPINIGTPEETSIKELVSYIVELTEFKGELEYDTSKPNGQPRRCADVSLAKEKFDFQAKYTLKQGLKETIDWYKSQSNNSK